MGHPSFAIPQDNALPADSYVGDQGRPSLRAFTVDFNPGRPITLFFSESVQADSLQLEQFILQNSASSPTFRFNFSSATPINDNAAVIEIYLSFEVRDEILSLADAIATNPSNTFLSVAEGAVHLIDKTCHLLVSHLIMHCKHRV